jgi:hypothetical protein
VEASDAKSLSRKMSWQRAAPSDFWLRDRFLAPKSRNYLLQFAVHGVSGRSNFGIRNIGSALLTRFPAAVSPDQSPPLPSDLTRRRGV